MDIAPTPVAILPFKSMVMSREVTHINKSLSYHPAIHIPHQVMHMPERIWPNGPRWVRHVHRGMRHEDSL